MGLIIEHFHQLVNVAVESVGRGQIENDRKVEVLGDATIRS